MLLVLSLSSAYNKFDCHSIFRVLLKLLIAEYDEVYNCDLGRSHED